ncbi:g1243 [Coccomyxa elongata]
MRLRRGEVGRRGSLVVEGGDEIGGTRGESIGVRSGRGGRLASESGGDREVGVVEEEVESLGDVFSFGPRAGSFGTVGDERGECGEVTEERGVKESGGGEYNTIVAVLKDVSAEGVEELAFLGNAKERCTGGAGEARTGVEGGSGDVGKAEGGSEREERRDAVSGEEFVGSVPGVKVFVDESFEAPSIGFVTSEEEYFEIAAIRAGVT